MTTPNDAGRDFGTSDCSSAACEMKIMDAEIAAKKDAWRKTAKRLQSVKRFGVDATGDLAESKTGRWVEWYEIEEIIETLLQSSK